MSAGRVGQQENPNLTNTKESAVEGVQICEEVVLVL